MKNTKGLLVSTLMVSVLTVASFSSVSAADFDCTSLDMESMKTIMDKEKQGETLTTAEVSILENAKTCAPAGEMQNREGNSSGAVGERPNMDENEELTDEQKAEREELKTILEKEKNGETLTADEQETLDAFNEKSMDKEGNKDLGTTEATGKEKRTVKNLSTKMKSSIDSTVVKVEKIYTTLSDEEKVVKYETLQSKLEEALAKIQDSTTYSDAKKALYENIINEVLNQLDDKIAELN